MNVLNAIVGAASDIALRDMLRSELGLSDYLVDEELLESNLMLTTYGALGALYEVEWQDAHVLAAEGRILHCAWINSALKNLSSLVYGSAGWMVQTYAVRMEADPLPAFRGENDGQRVLAEDYAAYMLGKRSRFRHFLALTYLPPQVQTSGISRFFVTGAAPVETSYEKVRADFGRGLEIVEDGLRRVARLRRLGEHPNDRTRNEFLEMLFTLLFDEQQPIVVGYPFEPAPVGGLLAAYDVVGGRRPQVGEKHVRVVSAFGYPARTHPAMLDAFMRVTASGCRYSVRAVFEDPAKIRKQIDFKRRALSSKKVPLLASLFMPNATPRIDRNAAIGEESAEMALLEADAGRFAFAHLNAKAVLFNRDLEQLDEDVRNVRKALQGEGIVARLEDVNTLDAFLGHQPFDGFHDAREGQAHTGSISRIIASSSHWTGRHTWNCQFCTITVPAIIGLTDTGQDFAFDSHEGDGQNFAGYGSMGSGKSTWASRLLAEYIREPRDFIGGIDKNRSLFATAAFLGADYRQAERYWLFANLENPDKRAFLTWFLGGLAESHGTVIKDRDTIPRVLEEMVACVTDPRHRTLTSFVTSLSPHEEDGSAQCIGYYQEGGVYDGVFDGAYDPTVGTNAREVHDLGRFLGANADPLVAGPVLCWVLQSFVERMAGRRSIILLDEAWASMEMEMVAFQFGELIRTLRHRHSGLGLLTQSIDDVRKSRVGKVVTSLCPTKLFFPNENAGGADREFYETDCGLSEPQIAAVRTATKKLDVALSAPGGRFGVFKNLLSPAQAVIYGCTGHDQVEALRKALLDDPDTAFERLFRDHGCTRAAERLRSLRLHRSRHSQALLEAIA